MLFDLTFLLVFPNSWLLFLYFDNISWIVFVQSMNLGSGKLTHNMCLFYTHPKTTLISSSAPSTFDSDGLIITSLGTSYF